jgi:hypothetical protein
VFNYTGFVTYYAELQSAAGDNITFKILTPLIETSPPGQPMTRRQASQACPSPTRSRQSDETHRRTVAITRTASTEVAAERPNAAGANTATRRPKSVGNVMKYRALLAVPHPAAACAEKRDTQKMGAWPAGDPMLWGSHP